MTSRDAINRVQRLLPRKTKIGHAGTLDPLATGVLVACLGPATRLIDYVQRMQKCYMGTFLLGCSSPTEDVEGEVSRLDNPPVPTADALEAAAAKLVGRIEQRPPDFSALKVGGRRAYDLARSGKKVELASRPVDIYRLKVVSYDYPEVVLDIRCGSGTYVRSLGRDLARSLGTEAVMSGLVRTAIGHFTVADAIDPTTLDEPSLAASLRPAVEAVADLPRLELSPEEITEIGHGRTIAYRKPDTVGSATGGDSSPEEEIAAVNGQGQLVALLQRRGEEQLGPLRNFGG